jgi:hypothetical protein
VVPVDILELKYMMRTLIFVISMGIGTYKHGDEGVLSDNLSCRVAISIICMW